MQHVNLWSQTNARTWIEASSGRAIARGEPAHRKSSSKTLKQPIHNHGSRHCENVLVIEKDRGVPQQERSCLCMGKEAPTGLNGRKETARKARPFHSSTYPAATSRFSSSSLVVDKDENKIIEWRRRKSANGVDDHPIWVLTSSLSVLHIQTSVNI